MAALVGLYLKIFDRESKSQTWQLEGKNWWGSTSKFLMGNQKPEMAVGRDELAILQIIIQHKTSQPTTTQNPYSQTSRANTPKTHEHLRYNIEHQQKPKTKQHTTSPTPRNPAISSANLVHNPNPAKKQQVPLQCLWDVPPCRSNSSPTNHETAKASEITSSSPGPEWLYTIPTGTATIFFWDLINSWLQKTIRKVLCSWFRSLWIQKLDPNNTLKNIQIKWTWYDWSLEKLYQRI